MYKKIILIFFVLVALISPIASISQNTGLHFHFNETSGTTVYDYSGNNNDGTNDGSTQGITGWYGPDGLAYEFNGTGADGEADAVTTDYGSGYSGSFTIHAKIKAEDLEEDLMYIADSYGGTNRNLAMRIRGADTGDPLQCIRYDGSNGNSIGIDWSNNFGERYNVTCVYDEPNSNMSLYVDGNLEASTSATLGSISNADNYIIGNTPNRLANGFSGVMDEPRLFERPLSSSEVEHLNTDESSTSTNFSLDKDSFEDGDYTSDPVWFDDQTQHGSVSVTGTQSFDGSNSLEINTEDLGNLDKRTITNTDFSTISEPINVTTWFKASNQDNFGYFQVHSETSRSEMFNGNYCYIRTNSGNLEYQTDQSGSPQVITSFNSSEWYKLNIELDPSSSDCSFYVKDANNQTLGSALNIGATFGSNMPNSVSLSGYAQSDTSYFFDNTTYNYSEQQVEVNSPSVNLEAPSDNENISEESAEFNFTPQCYSSDSCRSSELYFNKSLSLNTSVSDTQSSLVTQDHDSEGIMFRLDNGDLLNIFRRSEGVSGDHVDTDGKIVQRRYYESNNSWSSVSTIFDTQYDDRNIHGGITENGTIAVFFRRYDVSSSSTLDHNFIYSTDNGSTWSDRNEINLSTDYIATGTLTRVPGKGYMMGFIGDDYLEVRFTDDVTDWNKSSNIVSSSSSYQVSETDFAYLGGGRIVGLIRDDGRNQGDNLLQVSSTDYGDSWSSVTVTNISKDYFMTFPKLKYNNETGQVFAFAGDRRSLHGGSISEESLWVFSQDVIGEMPDPKSWKFREKIVRPNQSSSMTFYGYPAVSEIDSDSYKVIFTERYDDGTNEEGDLYEFNLNLPEFVTDEWSPVDSLYSVSNDTLSSFNFSFDDYIRPSSIAWNVKVEQSDGQESFADQNRTFTLEEDADTTPPTSSDDWTSTGFVDKSSVDVMISATDSGSGVANITYSINGGTETTVSGSSTTVTISDPGNNSLTYYATDNDGNAEASNTEYLALDAENPLVEFNPSTTEGEVDQDFITVNVSASDSVSGLSSVTENFNGTKTSLTENNNGYYIINHTGLSEGLYEFNVTAEDSAANQNTTVTKSVTVNLTNRPSAGLVLNASVVEIGEVFQADGSCSDSDGTCESIEYDWDQDGLFEASGDTAVHSYGSAGEKKVTVKVTDNENFTDTASENITVDTNDAPSASFTASTSDLGVSVDASGSSDVDGSIVSYSWDWTNDGSFEANGETASHSYSSGGDYTVKLKVEDDDGATDTATKTVSVSSSSDDGDDGGGGGGGDTSNPPTVSISKPNGTVFGLENIDLNYSVSDADSCEYTVNNGQRKNLTNCSNTEFNVSGIGDQQVTVYASNSDGESFEVREFETDLRNEIRLNSSKTGAVENFSIDFAGLESHTDNGVIQFNTSQLSTGNKSLTVNSEGLKPVTENFNVNETFKLNKTFTAEETVFSYSVTDESTLNKIRPETITFAKGTDLYSLSEKNPDYSVSINFDFQDSEPFQRDGSLDIEPTFVDKVTFTDSSTFDNDFWGYPGIEIVKVYSDGSNSTSDFNADSDTGTKSFQADPSKALTKLIFRSQGISDGSSGSTDQIYSDFSFKLAKETEIRYSKFEKLGIPTGRLNVEISKDGYRTRNYKTNFAGDTDSSIKAFLLENSKGVFVETEAIGSSGNLLPDTQFTLKRVLGNELETLSQLNASTQGSAAFSTNPDRRYTLEATHPEFKDGSAVFSPSNYRTNPLRITLAETLEKTTLDVAPLFSGTCKANTTRIECSYDGQVERMDKAILDVEEYGVAVNETICRQENTSTEGTLTCTGINTSEKRYKFLLTGRYGSAVTQADAGVLGTKDSPVPLTGLFMTAIIFMIVTSATAFDLRIGIGAGTTTLILANMIDWITLTPTQNATLIAVAIIAGVAVQKQ